MNYQHEQFEIKITFDVCPGMRDRVLTEIRTLLLYIPKSLEHASDVKTKVNHEPIRITEII